MWITEAIGQFRQLLAGKGAEFAINFSDGNKFVGKLVRANRRVPCAEGDYFLVVTFQGEKEQRKGWVYGFRPTTEVPDIVQYVVKGYAQKGKVVERVEIKEAKTERGGKKWSGIFFKPQR